MGTTITFYTNDANIYLTSVNYKINGWLDYTREADYNTYPGQEHKISFGDGDKVTSATFEATPYSSSHSVDYEFVRWVYRVGSISAEPQYSTDNPFTFNELNEDGTLKDIWIRAVGKSTESGGGESGGETGDGTWKLIEMNGVINESGILLDYVTNDEITEIDSPYFSRELRLYMYPIKYVYTSKVNIFTQGYVDTVGYISESRAWNSTTGEPVNYIAKDDDSGDGYNFSLNPILKGGETYYLFIRTNAGESNKSDVDLTISYTTKFPDKWDWDDYKKAKIAIDNRGLVSDFGVTVWNNMVTKVRDIIALSGGVWDESYLSYADTRMKYYDPYNILTATRFNSLRHNIGSRVVSTGIVDRVPGDIVYGDYFNILADCINTWIDIIINSWE